MHPRLEMFHSNYFTASTFRLSPSSPCQALPSPTPIPGQGLHYLWKHPILYFIKALYIFFSRQFQLSVLCHEEKVQSLLSVTVVSVLRGSHQACLHPLTFPQTFYHLLYSQSGQLLPPSSSRRSHSTHARKNPTTTVFLFPKISYFKELNEGILLSYSGWDWLTSLAQLGHRVSPVLDGLREVMCHGS